MLEPVSAREQGLVRASLKAPRAGAVAGILFSFLLLASLALIRSVVPANPAEGAEGLGSSEERLSLALNLLPFAGVAFLWLIGVLRDRIGDLEDRFFASVFLGSGLLFLAMLFVSSALAGSLLSTWGAIRGTLVDSGVYRFARTASFQLVNVYAMRMAAVFMISTSTIALRTGIFPRWTALLGYGIALLLLAGSGRISWVPMAFPVWTLLVSVQVLFSNLRAPRAPEA
jgi:hypothetical protein